MAYNPDMQAADLTSIAPDAHGRISKRSADLDGVTVTEVTFDVGAKWSEDLKSYAGTELCDLPHVAFVTAGTLGVQMTDGTYREFPAGNAMLLPPGHDAWSVGDVACTFIEFSRGNDYYAAG